MKDNYKKILIWVFGVIIVSLIIFLIVKTNSNKYTRPDYDYVGLIYQSEMIGVDAGIEYFYYIYPMSETNNSEYFYIKAKSDITIAGSNGQKDIDSGSIKNKNDLNKIEDDISNNSNKNSQSYKKYTYINNGISEECSDINEFGNKLFK